MRELQSGGAADLYAALKAALDQMQPFQVDGTLTGYLPAVLALADRRI